MIVRDLRTETLGRGRRVSATVEWEAIRRPADRIHFAIEGLEGGDPPDANAFLLACYPPAALHGEARLLVDAPVSPMLVAGLETVADFWAHWGMLRRPAPRIEAPPAPPSVPPPRGPALGFISGGVDSLHMLRLNRRRYPKGDAGAIEDVILVHGFDIGGKKHYGDEAATFEIVRQQAQEVADELGLRLATVSTNLRHLPSRPGFWRNQHHGAALAAVGHAATARTAHLFVAGTYDVRSLAPWGSHPLLDPNFSTQRLTIVHEDLRFTRLDKVRELASWPLALARLRVCSRNVDGRANCGTCEKCVRTRLELLAVGTPFTEALGDSLVTPAEIAAGVAIADPYEAACYRELLAPLRAQGRPGLARALERKLAAFAAASAPRRIVRQPAAQDRAREKAVTP